MSERDQSTGGGIGFLGLLTILFIGLKLGGVIAWPWLYVLLPLLIPLALALVLWVAFASLFLLSFLKSR